MAKGTQRQLIHATVGYNPGPPGFPSDGKDNGPPRDKPPMPKSSGVNLAAAIAGPVVATTVLLVMGLAIWWQLRRGQHRSLMGEVLAPRAGPSTTLLITDIQVGVAQGRAVQGRAVQRV